MPSDYTPSVQISKKVNLTDGTNIARDSVAVVVVTSLRYEVGGSLRTGRWASEFHRYPSLPLADPKGINHKLFLSSTRSKCALQ